MKFKFLALMLVVALCAAKASAAVILHTETYGFTRITNNGNTNVASQLTVDVNQLDNGKVEFRFFNDVGVASSITDVYFDDGTLLGIASISDSGAGVAFTAPASPANLPGGNGNPINFQTSQNFSAESDMPVMANGVDSSSEWVSIVFNLINGKTYDDTIDAIQWGLDHPNNSTDGLRIGIHVQAIGLTGGSDSYINGDHPPGNDDQSVPEPLSLAIWSLGLGCVGLVGMRRRKA